MFLTFSRLKSLWIKTAPLFNLLGKLMLHAPLIECRIILLTRLASDWLGVTIPVSIVVIYTDRHLCYLSVQAAAAANNIQSSSNSWTLEQLLFLLQELYNLGLIQPNRGLSGAPNYSTNSGDNTLARNQHLMTSAGGITPVGGNKSRNDHPSSDNILGRSAAFFERTETRPWSDTRGAHSSFTPFSSDLVTLEDTIPSKAAREFLPFYSGNPTTQFGAESSSAASYPVPYSRVDRAVSRPDSKLSLDSQAESDHLSATFASLDLNNERDQQRQG